MPWQSGETLPKPSFPSSLIPVNIYASALFPNLEEEDRPLQCVQRAGELLYVPEGWYQ